MDAIMQQGGGEDVGALKSIFPSGNTLEDYQALKMVSEIPPSLIYTLTVLSTLQKRLKSPILRDFITEFLTMQKSRDRKGEGTMVEVMLGMRRMEAGEEE
jgi:hypothetical protein